VSALIFINLTGYIGISFLAENHTHTFTHSDTHTQRERERAAIQSTAAVLIVLCGGQCC